MNTGTVARRYARALLLLTQETGRGEQVCSQIEALLDNPSNPPVPLEKDLLRLLELLERNGRMDCLKFVFHSFLSQYYKSRGICMARLRAASPLSGKQIDRISALLEEKTGMKARISSGIDPSILGGFVLDTEEYSLDASVASALEALRRSFAETHNRTI